MTWDPSSDNTEISGYQMMEGATHLGNSPGSTIQLFGLTPASSHTVTVRAVDPSGNLSAFSNSYTFQAGSVSEDQGLTARYHNGTYFQGAPVVTRLDATVNFDWGNGSPAGGVNSDGFSARWTGLVLPAYTQTYTFYAQTNDGVRLWVDGRLLIDNWAPQGTTERSGTIALTANRRYEIRLETFDQSGAAVAKLSWSSSSQAKQIIPTARLFAKNN